MVTRANHINHLEYIQGSKLKFISDNVKSTYVNIYHISLRAYTLRSWPCTVLMQMLFYILKQNKMARLNDINIYIIRFTFDRGEPFVPVSLCRFILIHIRSFEQRVVSPASNCLQFWKCNIYDMLYLVSGPLLFKKQFC